MKALSVAEIEKILKNTPITEIPEKIKDFQGDERKSVGSLLERFSRKYDAYINELARLEGMTKYEKICRSKGFSLIAGTDEAGRGPLAGPVCAAAVILPEDCIILGLNDSKKLTAKKRSELFEEIKEKAITFAVVMESPETIDEINILQATYRAMKKALSSLDPAPDYILADAVNLPGIDIPQEGIIKGDAKSVSIAAASILAKVTRDEFMLELDKIYPQYGFAKNKGYGSAEHIAALKKYGPCPVHRKTFIKNFFGESRESMKEKGRFGEDIACRLLMKKGYKIIERNWRSAYGEIDIIAENEDNLVFAEVKLRKNKNYGDPSQFVDGKKQKKIAQTAGVYLGNSEFCNKTIRFDIIEIIDSSPPLARHTENAFCGEL